MVRPAWNKENLVIPLQGLAWKTIQDTHLCQIYIPLATLRVILLYFMKNFVLTFGWSYNITISNQSSVEETMLPKLPKKTSWSYLCLKWNGIFIDNCCQKKKVMGWYWMHAQVVKALNSCLCLCLQMDNSDCSLSPTPIDLVVTKSNSRLHDPMSYFCLTSFIFIFLFTLSFSLLHCLSARTAGVQMRYV